MLSDSGGLKKVYLALGYTDLRRGIEGLAISIQYTYHLDPYQKGALFLFCGRRNDRIKGLPWSEALPDECRKKVN